MSATAVRSLSVPFASITPLGSLLAESGGFRLLVAKSADQSGHLRAAAQRVSGLELRDEEELAADEDKAAALYGAGHSGVENHRVVSTSHPAQKMRPTWPQQYDARRQIRPAYSRR